MTRHADNVAERHVTHGLCFRYACQIPKRKFSFRKVSSALALATLLYIYFVSTTMIGRRTRPCLVLFDGVGLSFAICCQFTLTKTSGFNGQFESRPADVCKKISLLSNARVNAKFQFKTSSGISFYDSVVTMSELLPSIFLFWFPYSFMRTYLGSILVNTLIKVNDNVLLTTLTSHFSSIFCPGSLSTRR